MALETASTIWGLNAANPASSDTRSEGDDHIRLVKDTLQKTFLEPDVVANRPAAGTAGRIFIATDEKKIYYDDGANWQDLTPKEPVGTLLVYAGTTAPSGYLLCDGAAVSRTTYADLFAAIGTTFGAGDGSTTFNVPDLRGRVPVGLDNMGGTSADRVENAAADTLGGSAGEEKHALTAAENGPHSHTGTTSTAPNHIHGSSLVNDLQESTGAVDALGKSSGGAGQAAGAHSHTLTVAQSGSGTAHNNMPPYLALGYIIKT